MNIVFWKGMHGPETIVEDHLRGEEKSCKETECGRVTSRGNAFKNSGVKCPWKLNQSLFVWEDLPEEKPEDKCRYEFGNKL